MTTARLRRDSERGTRLWVALAATAAIIATPLLVAAPAQAEPSGYVGILVSDPDSNDPNTGAQEYWDSSEGTRSLPLMTQDMAYGGELTGPQYGSYKWAVIDGALPAGITLDSPESGEWSRSVTFAGTPTAAGHFSFILEVDAGEGWFYLSFEGDVAPATVVGVAPSWTDQALAAFTVSVPVDDGVKAGGDAPITYSVSHGELPAGLSLSTATGAITGTPTAAGDYEFEITATNGSGHISATFSGTVATAPVIDLALDFRPGTQLADAASTISANGLKVGSEYTLTMHSTPVVLYTGIIDPTGAFTWTVALPANTPIGAHRLVLSGTAPDGSAMTAEAWFTLLANGTIGAISYTGPLTLANTGAEFTPALVAGSSFLAIGVLLTAFGVRRRKTA